MARQTLLILLLLLSPAPLLADEAGDFYIHLFQQLQDLALDSENAANVRDLTLTRDAGCFVFKKGVLHLCRAVDQRVVAAYFEGDGSFTFTPPTAIEQQQLHRFYDETVFAQRFRFAFFLFADTTLAEWQRHLTFAKKRPTAEANRRLEICLKYLTDKKSQSFSSAPFRSFLENETNDFFYAHIADNDLTPVFFEINPDEVEEVRFSRRLIAHPGYAREIICQFHQQRDYQAGLDLALENKRPVDITQYRIDCRIRADKSFLEAADPTLQFDTKIGLKPVGQRRQWLYFRLSPDAKIDSMRWQNGVKPRYFKGKDNPTLWVEWPPAAEPETLQIAYHGNLVEKVGNYFYLKHSTLWYPQQDFYDLAGFDLTFHLDERYRFAAAGQPDTAATRLQDGVRTTHWVADRPTRNASFTLGLFKEHAVRADTIPPISVFMDKDDRKARGKRVAADIAGSLAYFTKLFGACRAQNFYVMEAPTWHGEAFWGLINLSILTYEQDDPTGLDAIYRAHEVAHQWWGVGVDFATYHDQWLSEGLADYAGLMYLQEAKGEPKLFEKNLEAWRQAILENRRYVLGSGQEAGPIWLGYRTGSSDTRGDFNVIVYKKGAWILHTLRQMLTDLKTQDDSRFTAMLRDFYDTFRDRPATTADFQKTVEAHVKQPMDWFFQQWIYGTAIPTYTFAYRTEKNPGGQYQVRCRVRVEGVPADFQMPVPIAVKLTNGVTVRERFMIRGAGAEFDFPVLDAEPEKVIFNDQNAVLAEVRREDW